MVRGARDRALYESGSSSMRIRLISKVLLPMRVIVTALSPADALDRERIEACAMERSAFTLTFTSAGVVK